MAIPYTIVTGAPTYLTKADNQVTSVPIINKVVAADMNQLKASITELYAILANALVQVDVPLSKASFDGPNYADARLIGKTPQADFNIWTNDGSGTLLNYPDGYAFAADTGTLTMTPGNYLLKVNVPLTR